MKRLEKKLMLNNIIVAISGNNICKIDAKINAEVDTKIIVIIKLEYI